MKFLMKNLRLILLLYVIYVLISGLFIFIRPKRISKGYIEKSSTDRFFSNEIGPDRGILIDKPLDSGLARLKIIDSAKKSLNISYFSIEAGKSPSLFFAALIDAADRGVQVNILLDGIFHGLRGRNRSFIYTIINHPNMHLKLYEPINLLKPWTLNNRMHDKYIIADGVIAIIGGRNIGDKYFAPEWYNKNVTNDRDIIIFNSDPKDTTSVLNQMTDYFNQIWHHKYSKPIDKSLSRIQKKKALKTSDELRQQAKLIKKEYKNLFDEPIDLMEISFPTRKVSFIHNPISRFSKEPWCWYEITELMKTAKNTIFAQSPYIIPNRQMIQGFLDKDEFQDIEINILTNSLASTPNLPAYAGYMNYRKELVDSGLNIYEYQSKDSLHTKSFIIDDDLLAIGSFNSDPRSTYLSTESMVIIHSKEAVEKIEEGLEEYLATSLLVDKDYGYVEKEGVEILPVKPIKRISIKILSLIVRWFEYLL
ncbi:MAG TPA: phospholipase D family protein [Tissierellaceae bacterium]|nr:phospholipase D family protein [Tissierellaceae bacterium]